MFCSFFFNNRKGDFYFPVVVYPKQAAGFLDFVVFTRTPSQGRVWLKSHSTRSVAPIAQVTKFRSLSWFIFFLSSSPFIVMRESCHWIRGGRVPSLYSLLSVFHLLLLSFGGSCCFILRSPETLYETVLNCIDCAKSWMLHSRREAIPYRWQSD